MFDKRQSAVRNPLADPQIVGVTSGAGVGAILLLVFPQFSGLNMKKMLTYIGHVKIIMPSFLLKKK
ncbi:iron chelate uptake ABC transporter family permease subunit [Brevibacillus laterosporus]|nr:iron chelate uptake ABC transporter family permease subunit [Brevibacillus laterosporus]MDN9009392.1 iron chelate uptake ABC transporter family permease subunit [Brevibacillus laterosporus]MDO0940161.1 iron chelate uptake ABC transporter family permease subunit [Brevibacillus laterosporus]